ncbi:MAG TPA: hypothetical protein VH590_02065 [Ktedonobacterales bacterium]
MTSLIAEPVDFFAPLWRGFSPLLRLARSMLLVPRAFFAPPPEFLALWR